MLGGDVGLIGIYKITNKITNKIYIGQSGRIENRFSNHIKTSEIESGKQYNDELYTDMRKYGKDNFEFEVLETISLDELEEKWIQKELKDGKDLYNISLTPHSDPYACVRKFSDDEINEIHKLLKEDKLSNIKIAQLFNCSSSTIDNINNGTRYFKNNVDYPIRTYEAIGEKNHNSIYTDEEIIEIRKAYVDMTLTELYKKYGQKSKSQKSFERIVNGRSYKHLPIYIKREKKWLNNK